MSKYIADAARRLVRQVVIFENRIKQHVANCPSCGEPHRYTAVKFPAENDRGTWLIACNECEKPFTVELRNPAESDTMQCNVIERFDDDTKPYTGVAPFASETAVYSLDMNGQRPRFKYDRNAFYHCARIGVDLEGAALGALSSQFEAVTDLLAQAINRFLASRMPSVDHAVVEIVVPCACGDEHRALFYTPFKLDGSDLPVPEDMLLADVSGTDLTDALSGIFSKSYLMDVLDKLIVRWRLFCDQIVIASPFVGHQYKTKAERLEIWERLLSQLDANRTVFLTRSASYSEYKAALLESGLDHAVLERFGLENQIVSAGTKKQDFHAKVYIGLGERCEILSGSANLVPGKSFENAAFAIMTRQRVDRRYLSPLGVTVPPQPARATHHLFIGLRDGTWYWTVDKGAAPCASGSSACYP
jgi:hypothetical protein